MEHLLRNTNVFMLDPNGSTPLDINLSLGEYNEIYDCIVRFCAGVIDNNPVTGVISDLTPLQFSNEQKDLTLYGQSFVSAFFFAELTRKLQPYAASSTADSKRACFQKWLAAEEQCRQTNDCLLADEMGVKPRIILSRAKALIASVLGKSPDVETIVSKSRPGPGASFIPTRGKNGAYFKYNLKDHLTITERARNKFLKSLVVDDELWARALGLSGHDPLDAYSLAFSSKTRLVRGNRLTTVPKTSKIDRAICIEPGLNVFVQLGIGSEIRRRMRLKCGIDLDTAHEVHRSLVVSEWNHICTIDLSSASDTISYELVKSLLPSDWFELLDSTRSEFTFVPGHKWWQNQKFSSMGNGFTFELESLIFWAISTSTLILHQGRKWASSSRAKYAGYAYVFGDDIICDVAKCDVVCEALEAMGFSVNTDKTFNGDRALRESCGTFSLMGRRIPHFNLKKLRTIPDLLVLVNSLRREAKVASDAGWYRTSGLISELSDRLVDYVPVQYRNFGPPTHILDSYIHQDVSLLTYASAAELRKLKRELRTSYKFKLLVSEKIGYDYKARNIIEFKLTPWVRPSLSRMDRVFLVRGMRCKLKNYLTPSHDYFGQAPYALRSKTFGGYVNERSLAWYPVTMIVHIEDSI